MVAGAVSIPSISSWIAFPFSCTFILPASISCVSLLEDCSWVAGIHFACLKRTRHAWHFTSLKQQLLTDGVRWGICISFLFAQVRTAFRLDLHCLPDSPQTWASCPCLSLPRRFADVSPLASWSHFPTTLWFSLGNIPNHFHSDLCCVKLTWHNSKSFSTS